MSEGRIWKNVNFIGMFEVEQLEETGTYLL